MLGLASFQCGWQWQSRLNETASLYPLRLIDAVTAGAYKPRRMLLGVG